MRKSISNAGKPSTVTAFFFVAALFACTPSKTKIKKPLDVRKEFVRKHFNLLPFRGTEYGAIKFRYPEWFQKSYNYDVTFKDKSLHLEIPRLSILFTVEEFVPGDIYGSLFEDVDFLDTSLINNFHYAYVERRDNSLEGLGQVSETDKIPNCPFPALITFVSEGIDENATMYATASVEVDSRVYIFQFISTREMLGYVTDDFLKILQSVRHR